ncbi:MAG: hypothetical protein AB1671_03355 [Thermodesulfobacteriota bacterium]|jgi:hypothetical protein
MKSPRALMTAGIVTLGLALASLGCTREEQTGRSAPGGEQEQQQQEQKPREGTQTP